MALTRSQCLELTLFSNVSLMIAVMTGVSLFTAQVQETMAQSSEIPQGLWVPLEGMVGQRALSHVTEGGDGHLFAIGSGIIWRSGSQKSGSLQSQWTQVGRYAPTLSWDEAIGVNASGPFKESLLSEVERQVGESIEAALEGQGDEDWISEDSALSLIESFEEEVSPAVDSPYRVNGVFPQQRGVWLATGSGLWSTQQDGAVHPLSNSPAPVMSVTQLGQELWVSTGERIEKTEQYLSFVSRSNEQTSSESVLKWRVHSQSTTMQLINYMGIGYSFVNGALIELTNSGSKPPRSLPQGTYSLAVQMAINEPQSVLRLWALTNEGVWFTESLPDESFKWQRCFSINEPMTHLKVNQDQVLIISPQRILKISSDCQKAFIHQTPLGEGVIFTDASWWKSKLYATTSGGLFVWEYEGNLSISKIALKYLKRDLELFPRFYEVYQAALREQSLEPRMNGYGMRPVLSALMPQLTMRYMTRPSRIDNLPTFSIGSRQLTLSQPAPEYTLFLEWKISLDFLSMLVDPERGSVYFEAQNQIETLIEDPLASADLESELGLFEDWTDDTFTSQAQRLAMTTLALERRQKHRDRAQLRSRLARLHRERIKLTYQRWLKSDPDDDVHQSQSMLRLQELDAHLDAITGYRLQIQHKMTPSL